MQARGLLMIEHRLIDRMIAIIKDRLALAEKTRKIDSLFIDQIVDFVCTYVDRTHHGKEEDILFRDLNNKDLSDVDRRIMSELIEEHVLSRSIINTLVEANARYRNDDESAFEDIVNCLQALVNLYPEHFEKEDKVFFPASRAYFSEEEDQEMLKEFLDYDQKMIHEKYTHVVEELKE